MKILFFTKSKPYTMKTLKELIELGHEVTIVCKSYSSFCGSAMEQWCIENKIRVLENDELYLEENKTFLTKFDLGISNTYGCLIKKEMIEALHGRIFNIHSAPLPEYRGMFAYNWAIYNGEEEWGVTAHYIDEKFDTGNIIEIQRFSINAEIITVKELEEESQKIGYELTMRLVKLFEDGKRPMGYPQEGKGKYYSREDFEKLKIIDKEDSLEEKKRKTHACWCPPYEGAYIIENGKKQFFQPD